MTCLSNACFRDCMDGILRNSLAIRLRGKIAALTQKPVMIYPSHCQSEDILLSKEKHFAELCRKGAQRALYDMFRQAMDHLAQEFCFSTIYQDPSTLIHGGGYTLRQYNLNGINSSMQFVGKADTSHMNIEFGKLEMGNALRFMGYL
jgi:hypothetical protein